MKCRSLPAFKSENLRNGFSKEMINEARKHRKINQVYSILDVIHIVFQFLRLSKNPDWLLTACQPAEA